jgi:hypothetical protein
MRTILTMSLSSPIAPIGCALLVTVCCTPTSDDNALTGPMRWQTPSGSADIESEHRILIPAAPTAVVVRVPSTSSSSTGKETSGCADGSREGLDSSKRDSIAACAGEWSGTIGGDSAKKLCASGWHVCSPADNSLDATLVGEVPFDEAKSLSGCFAYNAAQDSGGCKPCKGTTDYDDIAGMGSSCSGTTDSSQTGCTKNGRLDAYCCEGGGCAKQSFMSGVVCCADNRSNAGSTSSTSSGSNCSATVRSFSGEVDLIDCPDGCVAATDCNASYWPPQYSVRCEREGYGWACMNGTSCDQVTPIDRKTLLSKPQSYCKGTANCPSDYPIACGNHCCGPQSTCSNGVCVGNCPYSYYGVECESSNGLQCCLDGASCNSDSCSCPSSLPVACGAFCCEPGSVCTDGHCGQATCSSSKYPILCGDVCCYQEGSCNGGKCVCPSKWPKECGDNCCSSDTVCNNGKCEKSSTSGQSEGGNSTSEQSGGEKKGTACGSQTCYGSEICVSTRTCIKNVMSSGCECSSGGTQCVDFVSKGMNIKSCGDCSGEYNACCPGTMCVNGNCQTSCP